MVLSWRLLKVKNWKVCFPMVFLWLSYGFPMVITRHVFRELREIHRDPKFHPFLSPTVDRPAKSDAPPKGELFQPQQNSGMFTTYELVQDFAGPSSCRMS